MKTENCPKCQGLGGYPRCPECLNLPPAKEKADDRLGATACSPSSGGDEKAEITCWDCKGNGHVRLFHGAVDCPRCDGLGRVPKITATWYETGKAIKRQRLARRTNMRDEAKRLGVNLIAYSDIERGKIDPAVIAHLLSENVKEHETPLAGASVETGVEVQATQDSADKAASGGCVSRLVLHLRSLFGRVWQWLKEAAKESSGGIYDGRTRR